MPQESGEPSRAFQQSLEMSWRWAQTAVLFGEKKQKTSGKINDKTMKPSNEIVWRLMCLLKKNKQNFTGWGST